MRLELRIDPSEDGDPQSPGPISAWRAFEPVLESELLSLCPEAARCEAAEVSVSFLPPDAMREVNGEYRGCPEATDVLSFPFCEEDGRFAPDLMPGGPILSLGDVLICPEEAARLHPDLSVEERLCLLLAHSFLHLLAWDHDTEERREAMWARQDAIKDRLLTALGASEGR